MESNKQFKFFNDSDLNIIFLCILRDIFVGDLCLNSKLPNSREVL